MNDNIVIREAVPEEIGDIIAAHSESWHATYKGMQPREIIDATGRDYFEKLWKEQFVAECPDKGFVAEKDGRIVAIMRCGPDHDDIGAGDLHQVYVVPGEQRKGIGKALCLRAMQELLAMGFSRMNILVVAANVNAINAYIGIGARLKRKLRLSFERGGRMVADDMAIFEVPDVAATLAKLAGPRPKAPHPAPAPHP